MALMTTEHVWVKHTVTPVSVLTDDLGNPVVFVDPDETDLAEEHSVYGCERCGNPMSFVHDEPCEGDGM